ncbi:MAG: hypothetical protein HS111_37410 [Kofleriaceae bacterium]|nr:hypothetical protein [Kofleriaceae bacterium]MCL4226752.1 hypothetical protein [Myxococcales bacterium]
MRLALLLLALAAAASGCGGGCNLPPTPSSETCEPAPGEPAPTISAIEIGRRVDGVFTAIAEDSVVELVTGGQGADMIVAALRLTGTGVGDCVAQRTRLEQPDGDLISSEEAPLVVRPAGDGRHVTGDLLLIYYGGWGQQARIRAEVGGARAEVLFWAGDRGEVDAATADAPILDAAPDAAPDATADDAAPDA